MYTILFIEDQFDVASVLRLMLSKWGYRALLASNLAEAQQIWAAYKDEIDLLLTDNYLPDGSGVTFAERIAQEKPRLKVLVASGVPLLDLPPGFHRLDKPFDQSALLSLLERILSESKAE
jgi:DNA-binding NtrC family response regulator